MLRLTKIVLDHFGITLPGSSSFIEQQDNLLPSFMKAARYAWLLANPIPLRDDIINDKLRNDLMESTPGHIRQLKQILDELGVHDHLLDVADSADVSELDNLPIDSYEQRLLKAIAHPNFKMAVGELLYRASKDPQILANSEVWLTKAETLMRSAGADISFSRQDTSKDKSNPAKATSQQSHGSNPAIQTPKRRKIISGVSIVLWVVFYGVGTQSLFQQYQWEISWLSLCWLRLPEEFEQLEKV